MLTYGERGSKVVLIASEPITKSAGHWVAVPRNSALVVARSKGASLDVVVSPLAAWGCHARLPEVQLCVLTHELSSLHHLSRVTCRVCMGQSSKAQHA